MRYISSCVILISFFYLHNLTNAIEPIGTIGHELPQKHVFHTNEKMLRVVQTHIEIVDVDTSEVEDEFGNLTDNSEVAFSPTVSHIAILDSFWKDRKTTVNIWDINAREIFSNWEFESDGSYYGAFSPIEPLLAAVSDTSIELWNWQTGEHIGSMKGAHRPLKSCYVRANGSTCHGTEQIVTEFTPDGKYLIVASHRPDIELWNVEKRELEGHFEGHIGNWVEGLDISHDGKLMASFDRVMSISEHGSKLVTYDIYGQHKIWDITSILTSLPNPVDPHRKELVTLGQVKRNQLLQNYPNPFNPETWIPFKAADENYVNIEIYKPTGELVRLLSLGKLVAGDYTSQENAAYWDGLNNDYEPVSNGVYFYTITADDFSATRKMLVIK